MKEKGKDTKNKYLLEALKLFGEKGYEAVKLSDIAKKVGVSTTALYKHYSSKQDLYDQIMDASLKDYNEWVERLDGIFTKNPEQKEKYLNITEEEQIEQAINLLLYTQRNEWLYAFRKLMMVEQYRNKELAKIYNERFIEFQYKQFAELFKLWMEGGKMIETNPYAVSVIYLSPILIAMEAISRVPENEEWIKQAIRDHVIEFNKRYLIKGNG